MAERNEDGTSGRASRTSRTAPDDDSGSSTTLGDMEGVARWVRVINLRGDDDGETKACIDRSALGSRTKTLREY
ncbi:hypothetical protein CTA1_4277 [Colletotrichum tanaceti]|uniref:Uncharacterized protein n=1 Tax=Colletotrichum tanaceti TaxID=1306861 RepID=A0A4U6XJX8_9PEZI|nr:hypothetical protein CTA1_4277 [Colletotrichum tanaceti]